MRLIRPEASPVARRIARARYAAARIGRPARPLPPNWPVTRPQKREAQASVPRHHRAVPRETDTLRRYLDLLVDSFDHEIKGDDLARRAYLSRLHFARVVRA